jgi:hypothetical protein
MSNDRVLLEAEKDYQKQYRFSRWWIGHREPLKRLLLLLFALANAGILSFVAWTFVDAYAVSYDAETRSVLELAAYGQADLRAYSLANVAEELRVGPASAPASGAAGKYDLYATVANPNDDWWAEFTYSFTSSAGETESYDGYVLPGEERPLAAYGVESSVPPKSATLVISDVSWNRMDRHVTGDPAEWIAERVNFVVADERFEPVDLDGKTIGRASFTVKNDTAYGYYEPKVMVTLLRGTSVVGVTETTLSALDAGEEREVSVHWLGTIPSANKIEVRAFANPFDVSAYKPIEGETPEDVRARVRLNDRR